MAQALPMLALGLVGSQVVKGIGKLIGGGSKDAAPAPAAATPAVMPTPDDAAIQLARRKSIVAQLARHGRESTMLTPASSKLGG